GAVGEMRFGLLALALASQALYFAASGGEAHLWSATAWLSRDIRLVHLTGVLALLANIGFASRYLRLEARRPRVTLVLRVLAASAAVLAVAMLLAPRGWMIAATSALAALMILVVLSAAVVDGMRGRQAALFLLAGWVPMTLLLLGHLAELSGSWLGPPWMGHALPASCALSGLVVTVGLGGIVRTLRRERDDASHRASYDAPTGALSRPAAEARGAARARGAFGARVGIVPVGGVLRHRPLQAGQRPARPPGGRRVHPHRRPPHPQPAAHLRPVRSLGRRRDPGAAARYPAGRGRRR